MDGRVFAWDGLENNDAGALARIAEALEKYQPEQIAVRKRHAAVALMLREKARGLELFVIKRSEQEEDPWSGHMALPGGGWEPGDETVYDIARRETMEEVGIDLDAGWLLGYLDDMGPRRAGREIVVSTIVVALDAEPGRLDPQEVAEAFWVPVRSLQNEHVEIPDFPGNWPAFTYKDRYVIWGLTHRILSQLWCLISG